MRIAGSATFLVDRARRRTLRAIALVVAGVALVVCGFLVSQQDVQGLIAAIGDLGVFIGLGAAMLGAQQLIAAGRDRAASSGEDPLVAQLQARLGDDFTYLRRVAIPQHGVEADGILLGPGGVLVLAIRALTGRFAVRGDDWYVLEADGTERLWNRSPTWELARPVRALQRAMQEQGIPKVPVLGAVVLVQGTLQEAARPGSAVVPVDRIGAFVDYLQARDSADPVAMGELSAFLAAYAGGVPRPGRRLASAGA